MVATVTPPMRKKAAALVDLLPTFSTGTSKVTGQRFYIVPASNRMTAHWTALDGTGCTCIGYLRRGTCTHAIAARVRHDSQQPPVTVAPPLKTYREIYPACKAGCGDLADTRDGFCDRCASDREWEARRAPVAPFTLNPLAE